MLSSQNRIPRKDFGDILSSRQTSSTKNFLLRFAQNKDKRFAVSVSKKVSKSAVARNTLRRRTYAVLRDLLPKLGNGLYLISAKPSAKDLRGDRLKNEITELLLS